MKTSRGVKLSNLQIADNNRISAAARDAAIEPVLRELPRLSPQKVAAEIEPRGLGRVSYKTVERPRVRLGLQKNWGHQRLTLCAACGSTDEPQQSLWPCPDGRRRQKVILIAHYAKLSWAPAKQVFSWTSRLNLRTRMRIPIILAVAALGVAGCNANQEANLSSRMAPRVVAGL